VDGHDPAWQELAAATLAVQAGVKLILTSGTPDMQQGLAAIQTGFRGYAHAHSVPALLTEVALVVSHGGLWLGPDLMQRLVGATSKTLVNKVAGGSALDPQAVLPRARRGASRSAARTTGSDAVTATPPPAGSDQDAAHGAEVDPAWSTLTSREAQIARAVASGRANKEIAALMHISLKTVKAHLGSVFAKLGVRDRLQLVVRMAVIPAAGSAARATDAPQPSPDTAS
jgi:DNA-binding NarL/FixJ family response regulator